MQNSILLIFISIFNIIQDKNVETVDISNWYTAVTNDAFCEIIKKPKTVEFVYKIKAYNTARIRLHLHLWSRLNLRLKDVSYRPFTVMFTRYLNYHPAMDSYWTREFVTAKISWLGNVPDRLSAFDSAKDLLFADSIENAKININGIDIVKSDIRALTCGLRKKYYSKQFLFKFKIVLKNNKFLIDLF